MSKHPMNRMWRALLLSAAAVLFAGCETLFLPLEYDDAVSPELKIIHRADGPVLRISGSCGRLGYVVEKIQHIKSGREIEVRVYISPFDRASAPAAFVTEVKLDGVDAVYFGEKRELLWRLRPPPPPAAPPQPQPATTAPAPAK